MWTSEWGGGTVTAAARALHGTPLRVGLAQCSGVRARRRKCRADCVSNYQRGGGGSSPAWPPASFGCVNLCVMVLVGLFPVAVQFVHRCCLVFFISFHLTEKPKKLTDPDG